MNQGSHFCPPDLNGPIWFILPRPCSQDYFNDTCLTGSYYLSRSHHFCQGDSSRKSHCVMSSFKILQWVSSPERNFHAMQDLCHLAPFPPLSPPNFMLQEFISICSLQNTIHICFAFLQSSQPDLFTTTILLLFQVLDYCCLFCDTLCYSYKSTYYCRPFPHIMPYILLIIVHVLN